MVAQAPLVAAELLLEPRRGFVEGGIGIGGFRMALDGETAPRMDGDGGEEEMPFAGKDRMRLDRFAEILVDDRRRRRFDMPAQGIADIDLLPGDGDQHGTTELGRRGERHGGKSAPSARAILWAGARASVKSA